MSTRGHVGRALVTLGHTYDTRVCNGMAVSMVHVALARLHTLCSMLARVIMCACLPLCVSLNEGNG